MNTPFIGYAKKSVRRIVETVDGVEKEFNLVEYFYEDGVIQKTYKDPVKRR
jgi:hypothetical protein